MVIYCHSSGIFAIDLNSNTKNARKPYSYCKTFFDYYDFPLLLFTKF